MTFIEKDGTLIYTQAGTKPGRIELAGGMYITCDRYSWMLCRKVDRLVQCKDGTTRPAPDEELAYYGRLEHALDGYLDAVMRDKVAAGDVRSLTGVLETVTGLKRDLITALTMAQVAGGE